LSATCGRTPNIINLLRKEASEGFPADYLVARLRGRRANLIEQWQPLLEGAQASVAQDEETWHALQRELEWVYVQMNPALRQTYAPVFLLFEIKTIVLCLRNRSVRRTRNVERLLEHSLLAEPARRALSNEPDLAGAIENLTRQVPIEELRVRELANSFSESGFRGLEDTLMRLVLEHIANQKLDPGLGAFFESFIDLRNAMILYKHLHWDIQRTPSFIAGGRIGADRFRTILERGDRVAFDSLVGSLTAGRPVPDPASETALESLLLGSLTRGLRRAGRAGDDSGVILDYLWRIYVQARNLAVLHHGRGIDRTRLEQELIL